MRQVKTIFRQLRALWRFEIFNCEIETELSFHVETRTQENIEAGMSIPEAEADALKRFGDYEKLKAECRQIKQQILADRFAKFTKAFTWLLATIGVTIKLSSSVLQVQHGAEVLIAIAILLRLFMYTKRRSAEQRRVANRQETILLGDDL
jgi:hypothetical protein